MEISARKRKQKIPQKLGKKERKSLCWNSLDDRIVRSSTNEILPAKKRRKSKRKPSQNDTHAILPVLTEQDLLSKKTSAVCIGSFNLSLTKVTTSFPLDEKEEVPLDTITCLQTVEIVVTSDKQVMLLVKQLVANPFCCCFQVDVLPSSVSLDAWALLVRSGNVCLIANDSDLHEAFQAAYKVMQKGDQLPSRLAMTLRIYLSDFGPLCSQDPDEEGGKVINFSRWTSLMTYCYPQSVPLHLRPDSSKDVQLVLPISKRMQIFYEAVKGLKGGRDTVDQMERLPVSSLNASILGMSATLRDYQLKAVCWMLEREGAFSPSQSGQEPYISSLHPGWTQLSAIRPDGTTRDFFYSFYSGRFSLEGPPSCDLPGGGILADEMGLGKTLEVLALVLLHPRGGVDEEFLSAYEALLSRHTQVPNMETDAGDGNRLSLSLRRKEKKDEDQSPPPSPSLTSPPPSASLMSPPPSASLTSPPPSAGLTSPPPSAGLTSPPPSAGLTSPPPSASLTSPPPSASLTSPPPSAILTSPPPSASLTSPRKTGRRRSLTEVAQSQPSVTASDPAAPCNQSDVVTCLCGAESEVKGEYIQCEECLTWQHLKCVGFQQCLSSEYKCIYCIGRKPIDSKTTLIISPSSIAKQWLEEIKKHTVQGKMKAIYYGGVHEMIHPFTLVDHDIVLTTFDVLKKEVYYATTDGTKKSLRYKKKYKITPSPLMTVKWWRLCVDEAQMVESENRRASEMCMQLHANYKWFVTGTPIQREVSDLYGLLLLLGVKPYQFRFWWNRLLWEPYVNFNIEPVTELFSQLLWRNSKKDVAKELGIPEMTEDIEWLNFSPVEKHFYQKQQEKCIREAYHLYDRFMIQHDVRLATLSAHISKELMTPLLKLRQACLHPHVVRGGIVSMRKTCMTMSELLTQLIKRAKTEGVESLRQYIGALNGLGGIYSLQEKWLEAAEAYRTAMVTWGDYEKDFECDYTQRIHTMEALAELLKSDHCPDSRTLADEKLMEKAAELRKKFLEKKEAFVVSSKEKLYAAISVSDDFESTVDSNRMHSLLQWLDLSGYTEDLISIIMSDLRQKLSEWSEQLRSINFTSMAGLQYWLSDSWASLKEFRRRMLQRLRDLCDRTPTDSEILEATLCHLRMFSDRDSDSDEMGCWVCQVEDYLNVYEYKLFDTTRRLAEGEMDHGYRGESAQEIVLKSILSFSKSKIALPEMIAATQSRLSLLEELKKEFPLARTAWQAAYEKIQGFDELNMASQRFRILSYGECRSGEMNLLQSHEVDSKRLSLLMDKATWEEELKKSKGQYYYLQSLEKAKDSTKENVDTCPICMQQLGIEWCLLPCGHSLCVSCTEQMQNNRSPYKWPFVKRYKLKCPVCRAWAEHCEIHVVTTQTTNPVQEMQVQGDHSTKIKAVIRKILRILQDDPTAKTLVFSQWLSVLDLLAKGLRENGVVLEYMKSNSTQQKGLTAFKTSASIGVLLLPLHIGANGLNIVEATHVILCEPSLNPAAEQQAIGRIHRMGQTRRTTVHRFYVKETVEEKMYHLLHPEEGDWNCISDNLINLETSERKCELTMGQFQDLFAL